MRIVWLAPGALLHDHRFDLSLVQSWPKHTGKHLESLLSVSHHAESRKGLNLEKEKTNFFYMREVG